MKCVIKFLHIYKALACDYNLDPRFGGGESESSLTVSGYDYVGAVKDCFFFVCTCHCLAFTYDIKAVLINKRQIKSC